MKRIVCFFGLLILTLGMFSCRGHNEDDQLTYKAFIGTWGLEKLEYWKYNIDYAGNPIAASYEKTHEYDYDINDPDYGIHLVYNSDKTGEYRDFAIDSMWFKWNEKFQRFDVYLVAPDEGFDSVIYCPDTVLVRAFDYFYDAERSNLYMTMSNHDNFNMHVAEHTDNTLVMENIYELDEDTHTEKMEKYCMKRVGPAPKQSAKVMQGRKHRVPYLSRKLFH